LYINCKPNQALYLLYEPNSLTANMNLENGIFKSSRMLSFLTLNFLEVSSDFTNVFGIAEKGRHM
jgi:hypothetical protein